MVQTQQTTSSTNLLQTITQRYIRQFNCRALQGKRDGVLKESSVFEKEIFIGDDEGCLHEIA